MSIEELMFVMHPPSEPCEVPKESDWITCQEALGTLLPSDYKQFVAKYGTGYIGRFIWILNPIANEPYLRLIDFGRRFLSGLDQVQRKYPGDDNLLLYPASGGILPFGKTDNGDTLFWWTEGLPETWHTGVIGARAPETFRFPGPCTTFLAKVLNGSLLCNRFPRDFPQPDEITFTPIADVEEEEEEE